MKNKKVLNICLAGLIAAMYVGLTYLSRVFGLADYSIQFRLSELLCVLPLFVPVAAIPGLTIGCILSNLGSTLGVVDIIFGSLATLLGALGTWALCKVKVKEIPLLSFFSPVIFNAVIVGIELTVLLGEGEAGFPLFLYNFATVGLGELVMCVVLGIPFFLFLKKAKVFKRL